MFAKFKREKPSEPRSIVKKVNINMENSINTTTYSMTSTNITNSTNNNTIINNGGNNSAINIIPLIPYNDRNRHENTISLVANTNSSNTSSSNNITGISSNINLRRR